MITKVQPLWYLIVMIFDSLGSCAYGAVFPRSKSTGALQSLGLLSNPLTPESMAELLGEYR